MTQAIQEEDDDDTLTEYSDLNQAVSAIFKCRKSDLNDTVSKKNRQRLTYEQLSILEVEFLKQPDWSDRGHINRIAKRLGLSKSKIYKWNWDRKKKRQNNNQYMIACKYVTELNENSNLRSNLTN